MIFSGCQNLPGIYFSSSKHGEEPNNVKSEYCHYVVGCLPSWTLDKNTSVFFFFIFYISLITGYGGHFSLSLKASSIFSSFLNLGHSLFSSFSCSLSCFLLGKSPSNPGTQNNETLSVVDRSIETNTICSLVLDAASMNTTPASIINSFLNCWLMLSLEFT